MQLPIIGRVSSTTTLGKAHYVLAQEAPLSGRAAEGIRHALQSLACLETAGRAWWVGQAHWVVGLNHAQLGEFDAALQAAALNVRVNLADLRDAALESESRAALAKLTASANELRPRVLALVNRALG